MVQTRRVATVVSCLAAIVQRRRGGGSSRKLHVRIWKEPASSLSESEKRQVSCPASVSRRRGACPCARRSRSSGARS